MCNLLPPGPAEDAEMKADLPPPHAASEENAQARPEWKEKRDNLWDMIDALALRAILSTRREEKIAARCCLHLDVWKETCGGADFMEIGMLSYWKDEQAPEWLAAKKDVVRREYAFTAEQEVAFQKLLQEELDEGIVVQVPHAVPLFLNPVFMVPKKGGKWRKVVDCRMVNDWQTFVHFRMNGPDVVHLIALAGDWATSLDIKSAFNHMRLSKEFRPFLCFEHQGKYYAYNSMPFGCRHSPRAFTKALSYAMAYIHIHWEVRIVANMDDILLLHQDKTYLELATLQIAVYLQSLGWTLSLEK
jgi:hypothetical protein